MPEFEITISRTETTARTIRVEGDSLKSARLKAAAAIIDVGYDNLVGKNRVIDCDTRIDGFGLDALVRIQQGD